MSDYKEIIKENIKYFRTEMDISQEELSQLCGYSSTYIGKIERGQRSPSLDTLIRIAEALQISLTAIFDPFYRKQHQLKDNWDPDEFSPYDATMRRFNYLVGFTESGGDLKQLLHLPWFNSRQNYSEYFGKKFWELPFLDFSNQAALTVEELHGSACRGNTEHISLTISGTEFLGQVTDLVLVPDSETEEKISEIRFEFFYPRVVRKGQQVPLEELNFHLID